MTEGVESEEILMAVDTLKSWGILLENYPDPDPKKFLTSSPSISQQVKQKINFLTQSAKSHKIIAESVKPKEFFLQKSLTKQVKIPLNQQTVKLLSQKITKEMNKEINNLPQERKQNRSHQKKPRNKKRKANAKKTNF